MDIIAAMVTGTHIVTRVSDLRMGIIQERIWPPSSRTRNVSAPWCGLWRVFKSADGCSASVVGKKAALGSDS